FKQKLASTISTSVSYVIYFSAIVIALRQFTIIGPVFYSMLAVVVVVLVFSATLTARDFFPNFYAGFALKRKGIAKEGSQLKVQNASGIVEKISWTKTKIKTESGDTIFISNEQILKSKNSRK
ncbi:mechanosensitive ion channel family protein, partial [Candidatus Woesearchaeota archaeon]|nr:mechanosensitive ion channel family protein [Candidatus Woesearchaeota archaeon]